MNTYSQGYNYHVDCHSAYHLDANKYKQDYSGYICINYLYVRNARKACNNTMMSWIKSYPRYAKDIYIYIYKTGPKKPIVNFKIVRSSIRYIS